MRTFADVGSFIESKTSVVQTSNVGFTSEVSDYLVVHMGPDVEQIWPDKSGCKGQQQSRGTLKKKKNRGAYCRLDGKNNSVDVSTTDLGARDSNRAEER